MTNIIEAICNIIEHPQYKIGQLSTGRNRINNMGVALENYVKDAFSHCLNIQDELIKRQYYNNELSWAGNHNQPPDFMINGGDAIEVKKSQTRYASIPLNSSFPTAKLKATSSMLHQGCRSCEDWDEKDLIYCLGYTDDDSIKSLWMMYGSLYAASLETYQEIKGRVSEGIYGMTDVDLRETAEIGKVNRVDPLGITNLRIRGMWEIQNPRRVFNYVYRSLNCLFELVAIIPLSKWESFQIESRERLNSLEATNLSIRDIQVADPNNPVKLIAAKLVVFTIL